MVLERDWIKPLLNKMTGLYGPTNKMAVNIKPE